jgi:hypothetical protein
MEQDTLRKCIKLRDFRKRVFEKGNYYCLWPIIRGEMLCEISESLSLFGTLLTKRPHRDFTEMSLNFMYTGNFSGRQANYSARRVV